MFEHKTHVVFLLWMFLFFIASPSYALVITSPKNGETFKEGDTVTMVAERSLDDPGDIIDVLFTTTGALDHCGEISTSPYKCSFIIRPGSPSEIGIIANARVFTNDRNPIAITQSHLIKIFVTLPPTVILKGIGVGPDQKILYLRPGRTERLYIDGIYSDGVERDSRSGLTGTTYSSSDEKVATVDQDGLVTAKSVGTAQITVKNGKHELTIKAIVNPKKDD